MVFASLTFLFWFLPPVLGIYYALPARARVYWLTAASYLFYGWWRPDFVLLMLFTTALDFWVGRVLGRLGERLAAPGLAEADRAAITRRRRHLLALSVTASLSLLGYFKYMGFGVATLNRILGFAGQPPVTWPAVILPVGISFYTFQSMSYAIDVYRGSVPPCRRFIDFACYVALFPQLVAGPIIRYQDIAAQLVARTHTFPKLAAGCFLFQVGFAKKVLLADPVAPVVDLAFGLEAPGLGEAWLGAFAYALQIYFDFSGYSDMALGLGLMLGFVFPPNFDAPYRATSITEFWRRWHMSLSTWLRDYLYISLGGNRGGPGRTYANLLLTMLLGGLWHGAAWTFVAWGAYHGALLVLERLAGRRSLLARAPVAVQAVTTFVLVLVGWVLFRAQGARHALGMLRAMAGLGSGAALSIYRLEVGRLELVAMAAGAAVLLFAPTSQRLVRRSSAWLDIALLAAFLVAVLHLLFQSGSPFLYYQF